MRARRLRSVWSTSGTGGPPEVISDSPLLSGVTLGYQRPAAMSGPRLQALVSESKKCVWTMPSSWAFLLPPATNTDPSTRWARPLQKMLNPDRSTGVCEPVAGSQTVARVWSWTS